MKNINWILSYNRIKKNMKMRISITIVTLAISAVMISCATSDNKEAHNDSLKPFNDTDQHSLKPFKKTSDYIAHLEERDRDVWQKPGSVVAALDLRGFENVADVGAGSGYFTFRIAKALSKGKVFAIDIDPEMIQYIHHKLKIEGIKNIDVILAPENDPRIPDNVSMVFMCDVLHHISGKGMWLKKLAAEMMRGGKLVIIEFKEGNLPEGPPEKMKIPANEIISLLSNVGYRLLKKDTGLLPYQIFFVFEKI
jgi:arsenite methyltransferase